MAKGSFKRSRWKAGNVYALPLADGSFGIAQAIVASPGIPGVVNVAVFDYRYRALAECRNTVARANVIALLGTFRAEMNGGWWAPVGWAEPCVGVDEFMNVQLNGGVGHTHHGGGVIEGLVSAYHGLLPWNAMYREDYYDSLLAPGIQRPRSARILNALERSTYREASNRRRAAS